MAGKKPDFFMLKGNLLFAFTQSKNILREKQAKKQNFRLHGPHLARGVVVHG
jgi:hypothetical protein